jgi:hypothetical protein
MSRLRIGLVASGLLLSSGLVWGVEINGEPNGFNDYVWGMSPSAYPALQPAENDGTATTSVRFFTIPGERVTLNEVVLTDVLYRFVEDHLVSIQLNYVGRKNRDLVMRWVEERYGRLTPSERKMLHQVEWHGTNTVVSLSYNKPSDKGQLVFMSPALTHQYNETDAH